MLGGFKSGFHNESMYENFIHGSQNISIVALPQTGGLGCGRWGGFRP